MSERRVARHLQTRRPPRRAFLQRQRQEGADTTQTEFQLKEGHLHRAIRRLFREEQLVAPPPSQGEGFGLCRGVAWFKVVPGGQGQ